MRIAWKRTAFWGAARRGMRFVTRPVAGFAVLMIAVSCAIAVRLATHGAPVPEVHDEFSYLLAANTFASGRLANTPHPLWVHFETFHVLQQPTYASKYPPGQGLVLALGELLAGHAFVGVYLGVVVMLLATYWLLAGWLRPRWVFLAASLAAVQILFVGRAFPGGTAGYWSASYWGGCVAATGGALVYGALRRLIGPVPRRRHAIVLAAGLAILANSRPYEGLVVSLPALVAILYWSRTKDAPSPRAGIEWRTVYAPIAAVLVPVGLWMAYYNWRVTGDAILLPAQLYHTQYDVAPKFLWQSGRPAPAYRHAVIEAVHAGWEWNGFNDQRSLGGFLEAAREKSTTLALFYLVPVGGFIVLALPRLIRSRWMRVALLALLLVSAALFCETWVLPHYAAPVSGLVFVLGVEAMRHVRAWRWRGMAVGRRLLAIWVAGYFVFGFIVFVTDAAPDRTAWQVRRAEFVRELERDGGRHLVLVRYRAMHDVHNEWVFNPADLESAPVIWARSMGAVEDRALLDHFKDRQVHVLEVE